MIVYSGLVFVVLGMSTRPMHGYARAIPLNYISILSVDFSEPRCIRSQQQIRKKLYFKSFVFDKIEGKTSQLEEKAPVT